MGELLLELLSEEIPARMQRRAIEDLVALVRDKLAAAEIPATNLKAYVTPRRLVLVADGIPEQQPERNEERRGPRVGAPQPALDGFLRATGLASIEQCEVRDTGRGEFYFAVLARPGRAAAEVLPELLREAIGELAWPKSMRSPASSLRWVRPLVSVICLFGGAVLPLPLDQIPVGRTTRGHRLMSDGEITVDAAGDYLNKLEAAHVILDPDRRRQMIAADLDRLAAAEGLTVKPDTGLLDEVTGLVEYPVVLMGRIDEEFVRPLPAGLPPEVLATAMRTHQKYFSCLKPDGTPAPRFLCVANNLTPDGGRTIIAGNERVLRARLADARFFWDQDRKVRLEDRVEALRQRVYYDKLGTMYDKTERIETLAVFLAQQLSEHTTVIPAKAGIQGGGGGAVALDPRFRGDDEGELGRSVRRAAYLAKADLSTGMVGEFPELQGVMGRYYALNDGEDPRVAEAVADHYKPLGPNDTCPTAPISLIVALADKIDALAGFFSVGEPPTGSRDPFALRRAAQGIIRLVLENRLRLSLAPAFEAAVSLLPSDLVRPRSRQGGSDPWDSLIPARRAQLLAFIADRLKVHLLEQGIRHDLIAAVFALGEDDLLRMVARAQALEQFLVSDDGAELLTAYRRAANIVSIEERKAGSTYQGPVDQKRLVQEEEVSLNGLLDGFDLRPETLSGGGVGDDLFLQFSRVMSMVSTLRPWVDEFFDKVTVNTDDEKLRENRLRLLSRVRAVMNLVADFSQIEG